MITENVKLEGGGISLGDITIDNVGLKAGSNKVGIIDVEQSDKSKLKGTMELSAGGALVGNVGIDQATEHANEIIIKSILAGSNLEGFLKALTDDSIKGLLKSIGDSGEGSNLLTLLTTLNIVLGVKADAKSDKTDTTQISLMQVLKQISYMEQNPASRAVTNAIWDKKEKPFRGTAYFSRPADGNAYTTLDAITDSTSAPSIMTIDLSSYGVVAGDFIAITNVRVIESTKLSGASVNAWIFPASFTATNDNAEFALTDGEAQTGGVVVPCANLYTTANNSRMVSDSGLWIMQIPTGTSIYVGLQASAGFTAGNNSRWDVFIEGVILK